MLEAQSIKLSVPHPERAGHPAHGTRVEFASPRNNRCGKPHPTSVKTVLDVRLTQAFGLTDCDNPAHSHTPNRFGGRSPLRGLCGDATFSPTSEDMGHPTNNANPTGSGGRDHRHPQRPSRNPFDDTMHAIGVPSATDTDGDARGGTDAATTPARLDSRVRGNDEGAKTHSDTACHFPETSILKGSNVKRKNVSAWHSCGILGVILLAAGVSVFGCAQSTDVPLDQQSAQQSQTNATSADDAATQGSNVHINVINAPGDSRLPNSGDPELGDGTVGFPGLIDGLASGQNTTDLTKSNAGYAQAGINISVTTGGTTPSLGGATAGNATGTQTASATQAANPSQTVTPEFTTAISAPVALPGGIADGASSAGGSGGTSTLDKQSTNEQRQAFLRQLAADPNTPESVAIAALEALFPSASGDAGSNGL